MPFSGEHRQILLNAARHVIRATLNGQAPDPPPGVDGDPAYQQLAGCFVSLHELESRRLRGCVGRLDAREPLMTALCEAATNVLSDPRFADRPVTLEQLTLLDLELTVLSALKPASHCLEFEPGEHGIYLTFSTRGACFLPQVARDTGWCREELLERLCVEKLNLPPHTWMHSAARLFTFTAEIIGPEPFVNSHGNPP